jgi:hypothetical protein
MPESVYAQQGEPIIVDHTSVDLFEQIPDNWISAASAKRVMFRHASTGGYISNVGLNCLAQRRANGEPNPYCPNPENPCCDYPLDYWNRSNWDWPYWYPTVSSAQEKFDQFEGVVTNQHNDYDLMGMKLCYIDIWWPISTPTMWEYYRDMMLQLEADYQDTTFIWSTQALRVDYNEGECEAIQDFNTELRAFAQANGKVLYDIADIEAHDNSNGNRCWPLDSGERCERMCDKYTNDDGAGGHPNFEGSIVLAKGFWVLMAQIAGWDPGVIINPDLTYLPVIMKQ